MTDKQCARIYKCINKKSIITIYFLIIVTQLQITISLIKLFYDEINHIKLKPYTFIDCVVNEYDYHFKICVCFPNIFNQETESSILDHVRTLPDSTPNHKSIYEREVF